MTTENTDAATRILTRTIRRLTARMTEADEAISHADSKRRGAEDELERVRVKLGGSARPIFEYFIAQRPAVRAETAEELAEKRMAELGELRQKLAELESLTSQPMPDYAARVDKALAALPSMPFDPYVAEAVRILRGEA